MPLAALVTSPQERCKQTAKAIAAAQPGQLRVASERGLSECDYGDWQGRPLKDLAKEKLWKTVQTQPSAAAFPGGESMVAMQDRAVDAVRRHDAAVEAEHGAGAVWVAVSHGDIIKSILADALGMHLDLFQRIHVDPASVSIISYTSTRPYVLATNTHAGDLSWLRRRRPRGHQAAPAKRTGRRRGRRWRRATLRRPPRLSDMPIVHGFDPPERFVAAPSASPARAPSSCRRATGARITSVSLEKQQVAALAERIDELLDEVMSSRRHRVGRSPPSRRSASTTASRWSSRSRRSSAPAR